MKVSVLTFGCKVNQYESEAIMEKLKFRGFTISDDYKLSDIVIFNSCTVTAESERKICQMIRRVKRENSGCITVLTGCIPQAFPSELKKFDDIDIIIGNSNKPEIVEIIENFILKKNKIIDVPDYKNENLLNKLSISKFGSHSRAFVKIEDGCNRFCSYCIIPYSRGRVKSKSLSDIKEEVSRLAMNGYKEVVLVGINLSCYGTDIGANLCDAVELVGEIDGVERIRLGSLEPELLNLDTIKRLSKQTKLCPQFHLSLQSGCDKTLKNMRRQYTCSEYKKIVDNIKNNFNNATFTTDVMVGFPGETEEDFNKSMEFVKEVGFLKVHVFPYSVRPGTLAAKFENQVSSEEKSSRARRMLKVCKETASDVMKSNLGNVEKVLYEKRLENNVYEGYTENYIFVRSESSVDVKGKALNTLLKDMSNDVCIGEIV